MSILPKNVHGCPFLLLAPMQGTGDSSFRKAISSVGGFDEAVKDFLRVPRNAHVKSLAKAYQYDEIAPIPLIPQIMGSDPQLMGAMAQELEKRKALRVDVNCGCPSNIVNSRAAGAFLLKDPSFLFTLLKSIVSSVSIPVTVKMRSGYEDISLFKENLFAAQESGVSYITLHPRTKREGYRFLAKWELIALAKSLLSIPVVGNGDIVDVSSALEMLSTTRCDGLMIGRGAFINPFLFHQIKAHFSKIPYLISGKDFVSFLKKYIAHFPSTMSRKTQINKLKQLAVFLFMANPFLKENQRLVLTQKYHDLEGFLRYVEPFLNESYP